MSECSFQPKMIVWLLASPISGSIWPLKTKYKQKKEKPSFLQMAFRFYFSEADYLIFEPFVAKNTI